MNRIPLRSAKGARVLALILCAVGGSACSQNYRLTVMEALKEEPAEQLVAAPSEPLPQAPATPVPLSGIGEPASEPVYAHGAGYLYRLELTSLSLTRIGEMFTAEGHQPLITDIAIDPHGYMFGLSTGTLYAVDVRTAQLKSVLDLRSYSQFQGANAMTFLPDGRLVIGSGLGLYSLDLSKPAEAPKALAGNYSSSGDVVATEDKLIYWTVHGASLSRDSLICVDVETGAVRVVGDITQNRVYGLGYWMGVLYGFSESGAVFEIDPRSAKVGNVQSTSIPFWGGTTNPVIW